jgi:hypothetical protein
LHPTKKGKTVPDSLEPLLGAMNSDLNLLKKTRPKIEEMQKRWKHKETGKQENFVTINLKIYKN